MPSVGEATRILEDAEKINPGLWGDHSRVVASTARLIASECDNIDEDMAYILGLLHDIGRIKGVKHLAHVIDGYRYLLSRGYEEVAFISITHSFPVKDINEYIGEVDCSKEDVKFIEEYIINREYTEYDRLIQLCDAIALPHGAVLMEKRWVDVVMRYGVPEGITEKWRAYMELKHHFDRLAQCNIYTLIPNIVDNTFEW